MSYFPEFLRATAPVKKPIWPAIRSFHLRRSAASADRLAIRISPAPVIGERRMAGQEGLEPPALGFGDRCSTN
jgi:hypothetical protein